IRETFLPHLLNYSLAQQMDAAVYICLHSTTRLVQHDGNLAVAQPFNVPQNHCRAVALRERSYQSGKLVTALGPLPRGLRALPRIIRRFGRRTIAGRVERYKGKMPAAHAVADKVEHDLVE